MRMREHLCMCSTQDHVMKLTEYSSAHVLFAYAHAYSICFFKLIPQGEVQL